MLYLQKLLPTAYFLILLLSWVQAESRSTTEDSEKAADHAAFQKLLDQVDPPALHSALHSYSPKKFRHGAYESDRLALEVLHRDEASLATSIVEVAKIKRQISGNGTSTTTDAAGVVSTTTTPLSNIDSSTTSPGNAQESSTPGSSRVTPVPQSGTSTSPNAGSSTAAGGSSSGGLSSGVAASNSPSNTPSSTGPISAIVIGSSTSSFSIPTNQATTLGAVITTTNSAGIPIISTIGGGYVTISGTVITTTNADGVTIVTTVGGGVSTLAPASGSNVASGSATDSTLRTTSRGAQSSHTSTLLQTTTRPDGSRSTVTAITVVAGAGSEAPTPSGTAGVSSTSGTATAGSGSLQTAVAARTGGWGREVLCMVGGAVGVAMLM